VAAEIAAIHALGCEIGIVVGGGNFVRGVAQQASTWTAVAADHMGMLSTVINAIALTGRHRETRPGLPRHVGHWKFDRSPRPYIRRRAMRHLEKGRVVIFAAGHRQSFFSHDTAASLRAMEIKADILLKATSVRRHLYRDPKTHPDANRYPQITYADILRLNLKVMDAGRRLALPRQQHAHDGLQHEGAG